MKKLIYFTLLTFFFNCAIAQRPVMIDNKFDEGEWTDAKKIPLNDAYDLLYKQDKHYYYLAVKRIDEQPIYVDILLSVDDKTYNIHASQQLGERFLPDTTWTDREPAVRWGIRKGWTASVAIVDRAKVRKLRTEKVDPSAAYMQSLQAYDGYEFQFSKKDWPLDKAKIRVEIKHMFLAKDFKDIIFPANSEQKVLTNWHQMNWKE